MGIIKTRIIFSLVLVRHHLKESRRGASKSGVGGVKNPVTPIPCVKLSPSIPETETITNYDATLGKTPTRLF